MKGTKPVAYSKPLADRVRRLLARESDVGEYEESGLIFLVQGHMCCHVVGDELMVWVGVVALEDALSQPNVEFVPTTRTMRGTIRVAAKGIEEDRDLAEWVGRGLTFVHSIRPRWGVSLPKIGFGTWTIGGRSDPDPSRDEWSLAALRSALDLGYTHFDTAEMYAGGHAETLLGQAIRESGVERDSLLITSKVLPSNLTSDGVLAACEGSLRRLGMDYLDLYLIHWPVDGMRLGESFDALNRLVDEGKVRHLGVSNFDRYLLQRAQRLSATPLVTNQVPYSFNNRSYVDNGVVAYCQANDILVTAYSPVEEGRLTANPALIEIAAAHNATPYQIALAWLVQQAGVVTIPMSANPAHQTQNLAAADIRLCAEELALLGM